jgi:hypothetical protein
VQPAVQATAKTSMMQAARIASLETELLEETAAYIGWALFKR